MRGALGIQIRRGPFGDAAIAGNRLRIVGSEQETTVGISIIGPATAIEITDNLVTETTAYGINVNNVDAPVRIERNLVATGAVGRGGAVGGFVDAVRVVGTGQYSIVQNRLDTSFPNAAVLRLAATEGAEVLQKRAGIVRRAGGFAGPGERGSPGPRQRNGRRDRGQPVPRSRSRRDLRPAFGFPER